MTKKKGTFDIRIKFEDQRIIDNKCKDFEEVESIFKTIKKKFK